MADWNDIKKAFERDAQKAEKVFMENEQSLLKSIANYIGSEKGISSVKGYKPEEILVFFGQTYCRNQSLYRRRVE